LKVLPALLLAAAACASAAQRPAAVPFEGARAFEHVKALVAIGPRPAGSAGAGKTRDYIRKQLTALGFTVVDQPFDARTPLGTVRMVNVRATLGPAGSSRLIIAGHYDTKLFKDITFVGANDGGSSTAFLIELARVLKARQNALPIELVFFDGEEAVVDWQGDDHTYGSRHYVQAARASHALDQIRAMILVDMVGDRDLLILRESNSTPWLTAAIWSAAKTLKRREFVDEEMAVEDDHVEFLAAGIPAVDIIDLDYAAWHKPGDTIDKCSPRSLQVVGDVLLAALPAIEKRLSRR
jgi:hypothetical protein